MSRSKRHILFLQFALTLLWAATWPCAEARAHGDFDADSIYNLKVSADGRYAALAISSGELAILDLKKTDSLTIYTRWLGRGFAWSPDSNSLVFIEHHRGRPPSLGLVRPDDPAPRWLMTHEAWMGQPQWLGATRIVLRAARDSDHVNLWSLDLATSTTQKLVDRDADITGVWTSPTREELVYACALNGASELWHWRDKQEAAQISSNPSGSTFTDETVSFSPSGNRLAYVDQLGVQSEVVYYDLIKKKQIGKIQLDGQPRGIVALNGDEIVINLKERLYHWKPTKLWGSKISEPESWNGLDITSAARAGPRGLAAVINHNLAVMAESSGRLAGGKIHTRSFSDMIGLTLSLQEIGRSAEARGYLDDIARNADLKFEEQYAVQLTRAFIDRIQNKTDRSRRWIGSALDLADAPGPMKEAAWLERLLIAFFEQNNMGQVNELLETMPKPIFDHPLTQWIKDITDAQDKPITQNWVEVGRALRHRQWAECSQKIQNTVAGDPRLRIHRTGIALLLRGEFDPVLTFLVGQTQPVPELMNDSRFQEALLSVCDADLTKDFTKEELRGMLMLQWATANQIDTVRTLALIDLSDPLGSSIGYLDILNRYLDAEEQDAWMERSVSEVLLSPRIAALLDQRMVDTRAHLIFTLAQTKSAFIRGDADALSRLVAQLDVDLSFVPSSFWDANTAPLLFLSQVFKAKLHERKKHWADALNEYDLCAQTIDNFPADWGITPFDLASQRALLQAGRNDADLTGTYLDALRGLGDPLINPAHLAPTLSVGLANLQTLETHATEVWLQPFLTFAEGYCLSLLNRPYPALAQYRRARQQNPPEPLLARILFDEAAVRSSIGQYRLAADLLADLGKLSLHPSQVAGLIKARAQAEKEFGRVVSQEDRMRFLCEEYRLPRKWAISLIDAPAFLPTDNPNASAAPTPEKAP